MRSAALAFTAKKSRQVPRALDASIEAILPPPQKAFQKSTKSNDAAYITGPPQVMHEGVGRRPRALLHTADPTASNCSHTPQPRMAAMRLSSPTAKGMAKINHKRRGTPPISQGRRQGYTWAQSAGPLGRKADATHFREAEQDDPAGRFR